MTRWMVRCLYRMMRQMLQPLPNGGWEFYLPGKRIMIFNHIGWRVVINDNFLGYDTAISRSMILLARLMDTLSRLNDNYSTESTGVSVNIIEKRASLGQ